MPIKNAVEKLDVQSKKLKITTGILLVLILCPVVYFFGVYIMAAEAVLESEAIPGGVAYWSFDEGAEAIANDSIGSNHGDIYGASWADGMANAGLIFDGASDYVKTENKDFPSSEAVSVLAWVKVPKREPGAMTIISQGGGNCAPYNFFWIFLQDGRALNVETADFSGGQGYMYTHNTEDTLIPEGEWTHIAVVVYKDGVHTYHQAYINGKEMPLEILWGDSSGSRFTAPLNRPYYIGSMSWHCGTPGYFFNGFIDELAIYSRALTAEEIKEEYGKIWVEADNSETGRTDIVDEVIIEGEERPNPEAVLKRVPNGWVLKRILKNGNPITELSDGISYNKVIDVTDGISGWVKEVDLKPDGERARTDMLASINKRKDKILEAVSCYYNNFYQGESCNDKDVGEGVICESCQLSFRENSLYSSNDENNNLSLFKEFPKELILAIAAAESGIINFDNEWVSYDLGHGIMQITNEAALGNGSYLKIPSCELPNNRYNCYGPAYSAPVYDDVGNIQISWLKKDYLDFKYFVNSTQGIYANIKDGLKELQAKYDAVRQVTPGLNMCDGDFLEFTSQDMKNISSLARYNGIIRQAPAIYLVSQKGYDNEAIQEYFEKEKGVDYKNFYFREGFTNNEWLDAIRRSCNGLSFIGCLNISVNTKVESKYLTTSVLYLTKIADKLNYFGQEYYNQELEKKLKCADNSIVITWLASPGELRVSDVEGNITGLVNGEIKEALPNSIYDEESGMLTIFFPQNDYNYEVVGTEAGGYGLFISSFNPDITFSATDIPTKNGEIHTYLVNWQELSQEEPGVTLQVDQNGDGTIEKTVTANDDLTYDEFILQTETMVDCQADALNVESNGQWVACYIELPPGYDVWQIDGASAVLNQASLAYLGRQGWASAFSTDANVMDYDEDGILERMVKFNREEVMSALDLGEAVELYITGKVLYNEEWLDFAGVDWVKVLAN